MSVHDMPDPPTVISEIARVLERNALSCIALIHPLNRSIEHLEDYFALRWARPDVHTIVVGSTGFGDLDWQPLPPESVTAISMRDLSWAQPSERAGTFYEPGEALTSVGFLRNDARAWPTIEGALRDRGPTRGTVELSHPATVNHGSEEAYTARKTDRQIALGPIAKLNVKAMD